MALSFFGLILLLLIGGGLIFALVGGAALFKAVDGEQGRQTMASHSQRPRKSGSTLIGIMFGTLALLAILAVPVLFIAGSRVSHQTPTESASYAFDQPAEQVRVFESEASGSVSIMPMPETPAVPDTPEINKKEALLNALKNTLVKLEESEIPLPGVRAIRDFQQVLPTLYERKDVAAPPADDATDKATNAASERPEWTSQSNNNFHVVVSEPRATEAAAKEQAFERATDLVMKDYHQQNNGAGNWSVDLRNANAVRRQYTEQIPWDFAAGSNFDSETSLEGTAYQTYLEVSTAPEVHSAVYQQWKASAAESRLETVAAASGCMIAAVALLAVFLRVEKRGFFRRSVRGASLLGAGGLLLTSMVVAAEGFDEPTHVGPARERSQGTQEPGELVRLSGTFGSSTFADTQLRARRIGFLVVGGSELQEGEALELISKEIAECVGGFGTVDYRVYCESEQRLVQTGGRSRNGEQPKRGFLEGTIGAAFANCDDAVLPKQAVRSLLATYRPDEIVVICGDGFDLSWVNEEPIRKLLTSRRQVHFFKVLDNELHQFADINVAGSQFRRGN